MNIKRLLGLDTRREAYAYGHDPDYGYTSAAKIPERWGPTTCGYCSVGCGMHIGVSDGKALAVRGNADHPVNLPRSRGHAYPDIVEACVKGEIKALWIIATNPLVSFPNVAVLRQGFENLDFLVVQDGFHPTPTTEFADLVLPAAIWGDKD